VAVAATSPARLEHARALVELGAALRRGNQRAQAREVLRQGADLAGRCGAQPLLERAETELLSSDARGKRHMLSGAESLTARRAARRRPRRRGSEQPPDHAGAVVATKTIEVHLTSVYRKLDIGSRVQLAGALAAN
jgi:hypothetical protein